MTKTAAEIKAEMAAEHERLLQALREKKEKDDQLICELEQKEEEEKREAEERRKAEAAERLRKEEEDRLRREAAAAEAAAEAAAAADLAAYVEKIQPMTEQEQEETMLQLSQNLALLGGAGSSRAGSSTVCWPCSTRKMTCVRKM